MTDLSREEATRIIGASQEQDRASVELGNSLFDIKKIVLELDTARDQSNPFVIGFPFKSAFVRDATDQVVSVELYPNTTDLFQESAQLKINDSLVFPNQLARAYLTWDAQPGKTITLLLFTRGEFRSGSQLSLTGGGSAITEGSAVATSTSTLVAATATEIFAQLTTRKVGTFRNNSGASIWVGPAGVNNTPGANMGFEVLNGEVFTWKNTAALYGYSVAGCALVILEEA
jgi:hypothetical protein